jgi:hypothetical protein
MHVPKSLEVGLRSRAACLLPGPVLCMGFTSSNRAISALVGNMICRSSVPVAWASVMHGLHFYVCCVVARALALLAYATATRL